MTDSHFPLTRRQLLAAAALSGVSLLQSPSSAIAATASSNIDNPYAGLDWTELQQIGSGSHIHCRSQRVLEIMHRRGLQHLAISNYYPSVPCRTDERNGQYYVEQNFGTTESKGYSREQLFRWNEIITHPKTGWLQELPEELQANIPFKVGAPLFAEIPDDVIICPNAEHHSMTDSRGHFNSLGSFFSSGNFDVRGKYHLNKHGYPIGTGLPWKEAFQRVFDELQFPEGGGLTINHPVWSSLKQEAILEMLDFDPRVLGIEIWNHTCEQLNGKGWALTEWDQILSTGRRCYGFAVSDHVQSSDPNFHGYNILLLDKKTPDSQRERACLQAYRAGRFYCTLLGNLRFESILQHAGELVAQVDQACRLKVITAAGTVHEQQGTKIHWALPDDKQGRERHRFVRLEAEQLTGPDRLFSQPLRLLSAAS